MNYRNAADKVRSRLGMVRFIDWLRMSRWVVFALTVVAVISVRQLLGWSSGEVWLVSGLIFAWLVIGWIRGNFVNRPDFLTSLAILDEKGGWKDQFSSAWAFLAGDDGSLTAGKSLHLIKAEKELPEALAPLKQLLPIPGIKWLWVLPLVAIAFSLLPFLRPGIDPGDTLLTQEMKEVAAEQSAQLKAENDRVNNSDTLTEDEKRELEKLKAEVDTVAEDLASADGATAMEVLEALESRARAAERLAQKLGIDDTAWASAAMLEEMSQHPDTADLALAIKDKKANPVATESEKIAAALRQPELTRETEDRFTASLEQTIEKATAKDREKPVGERVGNAAGQMLKRQPGAAAGEFEELAKHFRVIKAREDARKKLEELAEKLRDAGSEISGSKLQKMKQLAGSGQKKKPSPQGLKSLESNPLANKIQNMTAPQNPLAGQMGNMTAPRPGQNGAQKIPIPGSPNPQAGKAKTPQLQAPIPGQGQQEGGEGMASKKGDKETQGKGQGGQLAAPIPGQGAEGQASPTQGNASSGGSVASNGAQGGNEAGQGTAAMVDNRTDALKVTKDSKVVAQINKTGESTTRAVEGKVRSETAERKQQDIIPDFITVEEQALDSKTLPMSRRAQVLRYFSEIRGQFEKEAKK